MIKWTSSPPVVERRTGKDRRTDGRTGGRRLTDAVARFEALQRSWERPPKDRSDGGTYRD